MTPAAIHDNLLEYIYCFIRQELDEERQQHSVAQVKLTRLITESQDLQAKASSKDYRINNYDRINKYVYVIVVCSC